MSSAPPIVHSPATDTPSSGAGQESHGVPLVEVQVDYHRAPEPIHQKYPASTLLRAVLDWALLEFGIHPQSDQRYFLVDERTHTPYGPQDEEKSLEALGYTHEARLRLSVEHRAG